MEEFLFKNLSSSLEDPLDSLFIDNCIAAVGTDLVLKNKIPNENITYIFDNEPRNKEIIKRMYSVVEKDYNLVVWPDDMRHKDINDIIMVEPSKTELLNLLNKNTYSKLSGINKIKRIQKSIGGYLMVDNINVVKRNGRGKEPLNIEKIHEMVEYACEDVSGVSSSQIEMNKVDLQFYDGIPQMKFNKF